MEEFYDKINEKLKTLQKDSWDAQFPKYQKEAEERVATEKNYKFFENYLAALESLHSELSEHKKNNPSLYKCMEDPGPIWIGLLNDDLPKIINANISTVKIYFKDYQEAVTATKNRTESKLLKDTNAENKTGNANANDYDDPELKEGHYNSPPIKWHENQVPISEPSGGPFDNIVKNNKNGVAPVPGKKLDNNYKDYDDLDYPLVVDGMTSDDIEQGSLGNCYFLATLSSIVNNPTYKDILAKNITQVQPNLYEVTLYVKTLDANGVPTERKPKKIRVDTDFPVDVNGKLRYSKIKGDIWVQILEKAYAKEFGGYDAIEGGTGVGAIIALTNKEPTTYTIDQIFDPKEKMGAAFKEKMKSQKPIILFITSDIPPDAQEVVPNHAQQIVPNHAQQIVPNDVQKIKIIPNHAYSFVSYNQTTNIIKLRNPHGENHLEIHFDMLEKYFANVKFL